MKSENKQNKKYIPNKYLILIFFFLKLLKNFTSKTLW